MSLKIVKPHYGRLAMAFLRYYAWKRANDRRLGDQPPPVVYVQPAPVYVAPPPPPPVYYAPYPPSVNFVFPLKF